MNPARRLAAWTWPRSFLVADVLMMAAERDRWKAQAEQAIEEMQEAKEALRAEKAQNAARADYRGRGFFVIEGQPNNEGDSRD